LRGDLLTLRRRDILHIVISGYVQHLGGNAMALVVKPQDIVANQKKVEQMQKDFADMLKMRDNVMKSFDTKLKSLDGSVKTMKESIDTGKQRVMYHQRLKKEVELRMAGRRVANEHQDDVLVKEFIMVVARQDEPVFFEAAEGFAKALKEIQESLK
jgi:short subunit dehydrogenase-like uncharacterized protein